MHRLDPAYIRELANRVFGDPAKARVLFEQCIASCREQRFDRHRGFAALQLAEAAMLAGEVGGTSARLRQANLDLRWEHDSLSDVLRLVFGYDYGFRGHQDLDLRASSTGEKWRFELDARATELHAWDMAAQAVNPGVNVRLAGDWAPGEGELAHAGGQSAAPGAFVGLSGGRECAVAEPGGARPAGPPSARAAGRRGGAPPPKQRCARDPR